MSDITSDQQALLTKTQAIIDDGREKTIKAVEERLAGIGGLIDSRIGAAVASVAGGFQFGQSFHEGRPDGHGRQQHAGFGIPNPNDSWLASVGLATPWQPQPVGFTKKEGMAQLAAGNPHPSVVEAANRGLMALGLRAAYNGGLIEAPRKGMPAWQIAVLAVGGTLAVGGLVAGGMALAEVGPFKPSADTGE